MNRHLFCTLLGCALLGASLVSSSHAAVVYDQLHDGTGTLHKSSLVSPAGVGDRATSGIVRLDPPAPNPFRLATTVQFELPRPGAVRLTVYDMAGRHVRTIVDGAVTAGRHTVTWDGVDDAGRQASAGMYALRLQTADARLGRRMLLLR